MEHQEKLIKAVNVELDGCLAATLIICIRLWLLFVQKLKRRKSNGSRT